MEDEPIEGPSSECKTFADYLDALCAHYMAIGMSCDEFWYGDYTRLAYYVKANELRQTRTDYEAWLQGAYVYDALCMVSPVLHAFAKPGTKPTPYHKAPYSANSDSAASVEKPAKTAGEIQAIQATNASAKFSSFATQWNRRFDGKGGEKQ